MEQPSAWDAAEHVRPWWEREAVPCRDATPEHCVEKRYSSTECSTVVDPATNEPVRHCVKLYKRYLKCAGRPEKVDEQKQEITARGEGAEQLEANLVDLPGPSSRRAAGGDAAVAAAAPPGNLVGAAQMEDVGHAFEEFLRFAEELQEQMVPGAMHLDQVPATPAWPYSEAEAAASGAQQQQQQQAVDPPPLGWLGGLLFGKRRGEQQGGRQRVDASTWREFEREFTEV